MQNGVDSFGGVIVLCSLMSAVRLCPMGGVIWSHFVGEKPGATVSYPAHTKRQNTNIFFERTQSCVRTIHRSSSSNRVCTTRFIVM